MGSESTDCQAVKLAFVFHPASPASTVVGGVTKTKIGTDDPYPNTLTVPLLAMVFNS